MFKHHHVIGMGSNENWMCPYCECGYRERWTNYVIKTKTDLLYSTGNVLHFAPESSIRDLIEHNCNIDYYPGNIRKENRDHVIDITSIQFKDNTFDYIICNHVLEHVLDEIKAFSEVRRVLKENGRFIFSVPICTDTKTLEDESIISPQERRACFGLRDHVRLYGNDYVERFERYGFKLEIYTPQNELSKSVIERYGFLIDDIMIIARKA